MRSRNQRLQASKNFIGAVVRRDHFLNPPFPANVGEFSSGEKLFVFVRIGRDGDMFSDNAVNLIKFQLSRVGKKNGFQVVRTFSATQFLNYFPNVGMLAIKCDQTKARNRG